MNNDFQKNIEVNNKKWVKDSSFELLNPLYKG
jgi:hypothetical protein